MSPRSSDISTNSRSSTFLTTFGGNAAAGLNGPGDDSAAAAAAPAWADSGFADPVLAEYAGKRVGWRSGQRDPVTRRDHVFRTY